MKTALILILSLLLLAACGGGEEPVENEGTETPEEIAEDNGETPADVASEPVEIVEELVLYPEGTIDPAAVEPGTVIAATALSRSFYAWEGKEVTLVAYPYIWYGDSAIVEMDLKLVIEPESTDELARVNFDDDPQMVVYRGDLVALTGTFEAGWYGPELNSARFVDAPEDLTWIETSPYIYDGEPIPVDQFTELYNPWIGREVVVEGYYNSTTTSTTDYGVTVRVDLSNPEDSYDKLIACEMAEEISEELNTAMVENREAVQIRGTIADESFGMVGLENCVVVNR